MEMDPVWKHQMTKSGTKEWRLIKDSPLDQLLRITARTIARTLLENDAEKRAKTGVSDSDESRKGSVVD